MEPVYYTVDSIDGDYAYMTSDNGVKNQVAMFLLPGGTTVGQESPPASSSRSMSARAIWNALIRRTVSVCCDLPGVSFNRAFSHLCSVESMERRASVSSSAV